MKKKIFIGTILILTIIFAIIIALKVNNKGKNEEDSFKKILDKKTFILGLDDSFPPMGFRNEDNEIVGFDIDVAKEVCKRLGVKLKLQPISWFAKEQELESYNIDCIWNGMSVSDERKEKMTLSLPYLKNTMSFVVREESNIKNLADLKQKKIGVQAGSTAEEILIASDLYKSFEEVITYQDNIMAFMDMEINQIDAVFLDSVVANYYISENNKKYIVLKEGLEEEEYAIGFRKQDTKLCERINKILLEMKKDGSLSEISARWFGKDITIVEEM